MRISINVLGILCLAVSFQFQTVFSQTDSSSVKQIQLDQIERYIDSLAQAGMEEDHIPGAVIAVITDSSNVFYKAYGFANLEEQVPVDKDKTGFRIASITKTFTALAAMQLVEQGQLDLHTPVQNYLPDDDFNFLEGKPFTMHQLLTHTAGFDLTDTGDAALKAEDVIPLEELARRHMPDQVHDPGTVHSYSNFGFALAGYIIQEVSGMRYEDYMKTNIFNKLGMEFTSMEQPLPPLNKELLARSYVWKNKQQNLPRDYTNTTPGGGIVASAADMVPYMLMHLNNGAYNGVQLLSPEYHDLLTSKQYGSKQTKYGICYAFFENMWTTRRSLDHSGGQLGFVSLMVLIPETGTGIFIAQNNRKGAGGFRYEVAAAVLDTLLGEKERNIPELIPPGNFEQIANNYEGRYKQMHYPKATFEKLIRFFGSFTTEYWVSYKGDGIMDIRGDEFIQVEDHLFQINNPESNFKVEFIPDETGKAQNLFIGTTMYERVSWYQFKRVLQFALIIPMVILIIHVIVHPIRQRRRKRKKIFDDSSDRPKWISKWQYSTALLFVVGTVGVFIINAFYADQLADYGVPFILKVVLGIYTLAAILSLAFPIALWKSLTSKRVIKWTKAKDVILIIAFVLIVLTLNHFNMIGFKYY